MQMTTESIVSPSFSITSFTADETRRVAAAIKLAKALDSGSCFSMRQWSLRLQCFKTLAVIDGPVSLRDWDLDACEICYSNDQMFVVYSVKEGGSASRVAVI
jgi:hypothetical protein